MPSEVTARKFKQAKISAHVEWPVPRTLGNIMVFNDLYNGHVDSKHSPKKTRPTGVPQRKQCFFSGETSPNFSLKNGLTTCTTCKLRF